MNPATVRRDSAFQERRALSQQIENELELRTAGESGPPQELLLYGLGGSGKSQIALAFLEQQKSRNRFTHYLWINASKRELIDDGFRTIYHRADLKGDDRNVSVKSWLETSPQSWLLILDDLDLRTCNCTLNEIRINYLPTSGRGCILVTARETMIFTKSIAMKDHDFSDKEALDLLLNVTSRKAAEGNELTAAGALVHAIHKHPLAICLAGRDMLASGKSFCNYYDEWNQVLEKTPITAGTSGYDKSIHATFQLTFTHVEEISKQEGYHSITLFDFFAFLHHGSVSTELLHAAWKYQNSDPTYRQRLSVNTDEWWLSILASNQSKSWQSTYRDIFKGIQILEQFCLASAIPGDCSLEVSVHPLIHEWRRLQLSKNDKLGWFDRIANILAAVQSENTDRPEAEAYPTRALVAQISHLRHLCNDLRQDTDYSWGFADLPMYTIALSFASCYETNGYHQECTKIRTAVCQKLIKWYNGVTEQGPLSKIEGARQLRDELIVLAGSKEALGYLAEAKEIRDAAYKIALGISKDYRSNGVDQNRFLDCQADCASSLHRTGNEDEALKLRREIWETWRRRQANTGYIVDGMLEAGAALAESYIKKGRPRDAINMLRNNLTLQNPAKMSLCDPEVIVYAKGQLACAFTEAGQYEEALSVRREIYNSLPTSNPPSLRKLEAWDLVASSYADLSRAEDYPKKSREHYLNKTFETRNAIVQAWNNIGSQLPPDYPTRLSAFFNCARTSQDKGLDSAALMLYTKAWRPILDRVSRQHPLRCSRQHIYGPGQISDKERGELGSVWGFGRTVPPNGLEGAINKFALLECPTIHEDGGSEELLKYLEAVVDLRSKTSLCQETALFRVIIAAWKVKVKVMRDTGAAIREFLDFQNRILRTKRNVPSRLEARKALWAEAELHLPQRGGALGGYVLYDILKELANDCLLLKDPKGAYQYLRKVRQIKGEFQETYAHLLKHTDNMIEEIPEEIRTRVQVTPPA